MKKGLIIASSVLFLSGLAACGGNKDNNAMDNTQNDLRNTSTNDRVDNNIPMDNTDQPTKSVEAAQNVEDMKEVDDAYVLRDNNNAYVTVDLAGNDAADNNDKGKVNNVTYNGDTYHEVSTDFEQKIADRVREADSKIDKVYVAFVNTGLDNMNNNNNVPGVDKNDKMYRDDEKDNNRDPEDIVEDPKDMMDRNNKDQ
ncbi:hypothetical protein CN367_22495 [Priestia megaterium]|uniref:hypothetical protein n=1 Tax=Priestia megaterium TaxID=1404 RepID=UPI000BFA5F7D|nr:hypothetical protein [Priestia megaterium]MED4616931.1 hypothetical protein [Priestia megaterium]PEW20011.1 hypothetical protein CN435_08075 [Priestia megaterium]PEZ42800.1 hypothetical protein CN367_22495 [Priestia megaterium]